MLIESHRQQMAMHRLAHNSMMTCLLRPKASHLQLPGKYWIEKNGRGGVWYITA